MKKEPVNKAKGPVEKYYPGSYYDVAGLEKWLTQMAKLGMRLEPQYESAESLLFRQDEPAYVRFLLIPDIRNQDKRTDAELAALYADRGWRFICRIQGQVMVYETEDLWAVRPPIPLTQEDYDRKWRSLCWNIFRWVVLVLVMVGSVAVQVLSENITYYERITVWPWVFALGTLLPVLMIFLDIVKIYDIYTWWKHYRRQEEVRQWRAIPGLRWTKYFGRWVMVAAAIAVPIMEMVHDDLPGTREELDVHADAPLVTLALVDEDYEPHNGGVTKKDSLLVPEEIEVYSSWEDGGEWSCMEFRYYRLRSENMACRLAEDEAQQTGWRKDPAQPVETNSGFDAVWFCEDEEGFQYLTACAGDVAITIEQESDGDLMACLPEIYEIVTDYRANN